MVTVLLRLQANSRLNILFPAGHNYEWHTIRASSTYSYFRAFTVTQPVRRRLKRKEEAKR